MEDPFERWALSPPFPSENFTQAARDAIYRASEDLIDLGPKPGRKDVRKILKQTVAWFNETDREVGYVMDTEEREDILNALEELAHLARQPILVSEIDEWHEW